MVRVIWVAAPPDTAFTAAATVRFSPLEKVPVDDERISLPAALPEANVPDCKTTLATTPVAPLVAPVTVFPSAITAVPVLKLNSLPSVTAVQPLDVDLYIDVSRQAYRAPL